MNTFTPTGPTTENENARDRVYQRNRILIDYLPLCSLVMNLAVIIQSPIDNFGQQAALEQGDGRIREKERTDGGQLDVG